MNAGDALAAAAMTLDTIGFAAATLFPLRFCSAARDVAAHAVDT
jgi:hypothetical protein